MSWVRYYSDYCKGLEQRLERRDGYRFKDKFTKSDYDDLFQTSFELSYHSKDSD